MKKWLCILISICIVSMCFLTACSDKQETGGDDTLANATSTATATATSAAEETTAGETATPAPETPTPEPTEEPTPAPAIDLENATYLSDLYGTERCLYWLVTMATSEDANPQRVPGIDAGYNMNGDLVISGVTYEKGICIHPREDKDSEIIFDISGLDYQYFTAEIGPTMPATTGIVARIYLDYGEGFEKVYDSDWLINPDLDEVTLELKGAKQIKLEANNYDGNHQSDGTGFGICMLYNMIDK